ncbi:hypothetical protein BJ508DRAFT_345809 [Ascobolus immersus RN42]|uniref:Cyanovirin-N domain-containing protein n=1 Tax=Ascobolus immersus RN42 TaxID=1160509 RepID=A0A3N4HF97_ASCIM|nr:hypothetical protein BJ508DRAFT_345809 [Ascobolus immersus RN42]
MKFTRSATFLASLITLATARNFIEHCEMDEHGRIGEFSDGMYFATCHGEQYKMDSEMELSDCIANDNGVMVARENGGFWGSCQSCSLDASTSSSQWFNCICKDREGNFLNTSINLAEFMAVDDQWGNFYCFNSQSRNLGGGSPFDPESVKETSKAVEGKNTRRGRR